MRKELDLIEKIELYLSDELDPVQKQEFETQLSEDPQLQEEVNLQKDLMGGFERIGMKDEISTGLKKYNRSLKIKQLIAVGLITSAIGTGIWLLSQNENKEKVTANEVQVTKEIQKTTPDISEEQLPYIADTTKAIVKRPTQDTPTKAHIKKEETIDQIPEAITPEVNKEEPNAPAISANAGKEEITEPKTSSQPTVENAPVTETHPTLSGQGSFRPYDPEKNTARELFIPNAFSPNGDGLNDVFQISEEGLSDVRCIIINLEGDKVYEWSGLNGYWDGITGTENQRSNVYIYNLIVKYEGLKEFSPIRRGTVTIIK